MRDVKKPDLHSAPSVSWKEASPLIIHTCISSVKEPCEQRLHRNRAARDVYMAPAPRWLASRNLVRKRRVRWCSSHHSQAWPNLIRT